MAKAAKRTLYFTRIKLTNWRNFRRAEVTLERRAFFVGPNASGKSNLLDAFRFLRDLAVPTGGGLQAAVEHRQGISHLRSLFAGNPGFVEIDVDVGDDDNPRRWSYRLRFTKDKGRDRAIIEEEEVFLRDTHEEWPLLQRTIGSEADREALTQTHAEQTAQNRDFRDLVSFFASINYSNVVPQIVRDSFRQAKNSEDPFGGDLVARMSATPAHLLKARMRSLNRALQVVVPDLSDVRIVHDPISAKHHLEAAIKTWRSNVRSLREREFSDGTLRLIGFIWAILDSRGPLLLEEPELYLNEEVVRQLSQLISRVQSRAARGRQVLISTHSLALISDPGIGLDEVLEISVDGNGSTVRRAGDDPTTRALVQAGISVGEATMGKLRAETRDRLAFALDD